MDQPVSRAEFEAFRQEIRQEVREQITEEIKASKVIIVSDDALKSISEKLMTIALGILTAQESDIKEMKGDIRDIKTAQEQQNAKLDQILDRLPPKAE